MSQSAQFHPAAEPELIAAVEFYEAQAFGLGTDLLEELERVVARAAEAPAVGASYAAGTRRLLARRFPYAVVYRERPGKPIEVVAIAHFRRRPYYWRRRV